MSETEDREHAPVRLSELCSCGHVRGMHPLGQSENIFCMGRCLLCKCRTFIIPSLEGASHEEEAVNPPVSCVGLSESETPVGGRLSILPPNVDGCGANALSSIGEVVPRPRPEPALDELLARIDVQVGDLLNGNTMRVLRDCRTALTEICICAAIQLADGRIIRGHRHDDCLQTAIKWQAEPRAAQQGFVTSRNRFVDRREGMRLQNAAGIESVNGYRGEVLFSEDLY